MTNYASTEDLRSYLGITDDSKDSLLTLHLESAESQINHILGVDTLKKSQITERIKIENVDQFGFTFVTSKRPVITLDEIDGTPYTGVKGTDYIVEHQRRIVIKMIIINKLWFDSVEIKYTAGLTEIPAQIKLATLMIAANSYNLGGSNGVYQSYAIGDEKVTFKNASEQQQFLDLIKPFKMFH